MNNLPRIELASQEACDIFEKECDEIIAALGVEDALITDESQVMDFLFPMVWGMDEATLARARQEEAQLTQKLSLLVGRPVKPSDRIWELGRDLHLLREQQKQESAARARPH